jgi:hypothetical protein
MPTRNLGSAQAQGPLLDRHKRKASSWIGTRPPPKPILSPDPYGAAPFSRFPTRRHRKTGWGQPYPPTVLPTPSMRPHRPDEISQQYDCSEKEDSNEEANQTKQAPQPFPNSASAYYNTLRNPNSG